MTKRTFKPYQIEDLTGGINIRDFPTEIEEGQAVAIKNWNFNKSRLVSEKWAEATNLPETPRLGGLTIDSWDIWTVSDWRIYQNWVQIEDWTWILVSANKETFQPWVKFYITIEWVDYTISWETVQDFIINLQSEVQANWLTTVFQEDLLLIRKSNWSSINYSTRNNQAYVIYNEDNVSSYVFWLEYPYRISINWVEYSGVYTPSSDSLNAWQKDIEMLEEINWQLPSNLDSEVIFIDSFYNQINDYESSAWILINNIDSFEEFKDKKYRYRINWYTLSSNIPSDEFTPNTWITLEWNSVGWTYWYSRFWFWSVSSVYNIDHTINGVTFNISWSYTWNQYTNLVANNINTLVPNLVAQSYERSNSYWYFVYNEIDWREIISSTNDNWQTSVSGLSDNPTPADLNIVELPNMQALMENRIKNELTRLGYIADENSLTWSLGMLYFKSDYSEIPFDNTWELTLNQLDFFSSELIAHTYDNAIPIVNPLEIWNWLSGRANITIGNLGNLIVDKDDWGAFYAYDWLNIKIWQDSIWEPTVGTIYNWKIILGWYEGNDNIIFSKTSSPILPLNVLDFAEYSAWGQSVSWGDKGTITWMSVWENWLYVFKDNSIWYSNSERDAPESFSFNLVFNKITSNWALSQNVITEVDQEILYLDWKTREVRRLGYEQNLTTLRDTAISRDISELFDSLPEEQPLATSHFKYPNYQLSLTDWLSEEVEYNNGNSYNSNNKHFIYNVENKSWTTRDWVEDIIVSSDWYFAGIDWKIYKDFEWFAEQWEFCSKKYTMSDDMQLKKFGWFNIVGFVYPEKGESLTLEIDIIVDWERLETLDYKYDKAERIRERIDLCNDLWQDFQFKIRYSWIWRVEMYDAQILYKRTTIKENYT